MCDACNDDTPVVPRVPASSRAGKRSRPLLHAPDDGLGPAGIRVAQIMRGNGAPYQEIADSLHVRRSFIHRVLSENRSSIW